MHSPGRLAPSTVAAMVSHLRRKLVPPSRRVTEPGGRSRRRSLGAVACVAGASGLLAVTVAVTAGSLTAAASAPKVAAAATSKPPVSVSPQPGTRTATTATTISFVGVPASELGTITVTGSSSGTHDGTVKAFSQGDGGAFVPNRRFSSNETVTVHTSLNIVGGSNGTFSFSIAPPLPGNAPSTAALKAAIDAGGFPGPSPKLSTGSAAGTRAHPDNTYISNPGIQPPKVTIDLHASSGLAGGYFFMSPRGNSGQAGPYIVDQHGFPIWFDPIKGSLALDFKEQTWNGKPVLTWWQGVIGPGFGTSGYYSIRDEHYHQLATVHAGNGLPSDLHEFLIGPDNTAWITAYHLIGWDMSSVGGPTDGTIVDSAVQEIDLKTGLVRFEWHALDHVPLSAGYTGVPSSSAQLWDWFHVNSVQVLKNGDIIVSSRNTHQVYEVSTSTGSVIWALGGKQSSFTMGPNTEFAWQHDARLRPNGTLSLFDDDDGGGQGGPESSGLVLNLNMSNHTATLAHRYYRTPAVYTGSQGNLQELKGGNVLVGFGAEPYETEFTSSGTEVLDAQLPTGFETYRVYLWGWKGLPTTKPGIAVVNGSPNRVHASWNGATQTAVWQVLGGSSPSSLKVVAKHNRHGFETVISVPSEAYYAVQSLNSAGHVLGTSNTVKG